jgi:hypothetical protein
MDQGISGGAIQLGHSTLNNSIKKGDIERDSLGKLDHRWLRITEMYIEMQCRSRK